MFYFIGKYLVLSDSGHEIVDFLNPNTKYDLLANNVPRVSHATGGLLQNSPIVCGGKDEQYNGSQDCVVIGQQAEMKMTEKRSAASVALDKSTLWIVGGDSFLSSTEFIKLGQPSVKGPDLPFAIRSHSLIQYDEKSVYIIGGVQDSDVPCSETCIYVHATCNPGRNISNKTWIVDTTNEFQITEGPSLNEAREKHGCAKMTLNGRTILVVAGGCRSYGEDFKPLYSVEILDPSENNVWTPGSYLKSITVEYLDYK